MRRIERQGTAATSDVLASKVGRESFKFQLLCISNTPQISFFISRSVEVRKTILLLSFLLLHRTKRNLKGKEKTEKRKKS